VRRVIDMAKKNESTVDTVIEETNMVSEKESQKSPKITIGKFFQLYGKNVHRYSQAYLGERFRGIMKTREEWSEEAEIKRNMEGES
jgi:hypothetical protein